MFLGLIFDNTATDFVVVGYFLKDLSVPVPFQVFPVVLEHHGPAQAL